MVVVCAGCATTEGYNPVAAANNQTFLLNESAFKAVKEGMTLAQVHQLMGQEIIIGYTSQPQGAYQPLTIPNPYKSETVKTYAVEYYVTAIHQADGIISDDELIPFVFKDGVLTGRGWPFLKALRPAA